MAWGLEARVPFLDVKFLEEAMSVDPKEKMFGKKEVDEDGIPRIEKVRISSQDRRVFDLYQYIIRKAFATTPDNKVWNHNNTLHAVVMEFK